MVPSHRQTGWLSGQKLITTNGIKPGIILTSENLHPLLALISTHSLGDWRAEPVKGMFTAQPELGRLKCFYRAHCDLSHTKEP